MSCAQIQLQAKRYKREEGVEVVHGAQLCIRMKGLGQIERVASSEVLTFEVGYQRDDAHVSCIR